MTLPVLAVVGTGAVARAVARLHADAGGTIRCVASRADARAAALAGRVRARAAHDDADLLGADVVLVAVADRAVPDVGRRLARVPGAARPIVLHTSGALAGSDLGGPPLSAGSLHPLQSFPPPSDDGEGGDRELAQRARGCHWFHEGDGEDVARTLVAAWGGTFHPLAAGAKVLYHAAAAIVSNHTVALFDAATQLLDAAGTLPGEARAPLASLLAGTTANLAAKGPLDALTGPVVRGDVETVVRHVQALRGAAPHLVPSYVEAALLAVDVGVRRGSLDAAAAARLRDVLDAGRRPPDASR